MTFSTGYDMSLQSKFNDRLGRIYTYVALSWSFILFGGAMFLFANRSLPFLRIRNVALTISAVATLHVYWILCLLAYGLNGFFPCNTEFWIMNVYLPFGIALFHASNYQLLFIADRQRRFASTETLLSEKNKDDGHGGYKHILRWTRSHRVSRKTMLCIGVGMIVQLLCAVVIFLTSKKFHSAFGVTGHVTPETEEGRKDCRRGWEWVPSVIWQFFWSWMYAPYLLWKVRGIHDVHGWRMQTICCCIAGLPATPMWLFALYLPQMKPADRYWIPPLWFAPSILLIEAFMIFVPCWQILGNRRLKRETLATIAEWERQKSGSSVDSSTNTATHAAIHLSHQASIISSTSTHSRKAQPHLYTMTALDKALETNPTPLLLFAALQDFSGENISFLNHVQQWKQNWRQTQRYSLLRLSPAALVGDATLRRQQFNQAVEIYSTFVSLKYSDYPINLSHNHLKDLEAMFEGAAALVNSNRDSSNAATPFEDWLHTDPDDVRESSVPEHTSVFSNLVNDSKEDLFSATAQRHASILGGYELKEVGSKLPKNVPIPAGFGPTIFDRAADHIKYIVLTGTWPKFVNAGYANKIGKGSIAKRIHDQFTKV